jgi:predicted ATP-binding protein involved in virulence
MRLKKFSVDGLFGLFNHHVPLRLEDNITIIHAPNGYGKTVILKLISAFFGGSLKLFREIEYNRINFEFDDGGIVTISQRIEGDNRSKSTKILRVYAIRYLSADGEEYIHDPWADGFFDKSGRVIVRDEAIRYIERYVPHIERVGTDRFRDRNSREMYTTSDLLKLYSDLFPFSGKSHPAWLDELRGSVHCQLIETQRLMVSAKEAVRGGRDDSTFIPAVKTNSDNLVVLIRRNLADSATLSQSLDRTFPNRLLSESTKPLLEAELRTRLTALEQLRARLTEVGLLDKSDDSAFIPKRSFSESHRLILTEYVNDAEKKLHVLENLLSRLELLTTIINRRFQFKTLTISRDHGLVFTDIRQRRVELENLSSGEQHELVLVYDLLFKTQKNTLLLIDEPEISLHVAWQKKFLSDLRQIIKLSPMDIVLSTHSPQLIGNYIDVAIQLRGPVDDK